MNDNSPSLFMGSLLATALTTITKNCEPLEDGGTKDFWLPGAVSGRALCFVTVGT